MFFINSIQNVTQNVIQNVIQNVQKRIEQRWPLTYQYVYQRVRSWQWATWVYCSRRSWMCPVRLLEEDKRSLRLNYFYNNTVYSIRIMKKKRGPIPFVVISILSEQENVTDFILPFMGPALNFHGMRYCPSDFGYQKLSFSIVWNGIPEVVSFTEREVMDIYRVKMI
jgi:hypothetical protein